MKYPPISMIVAMTPRGVIGNKGHMPWHLPTDLRHFQRRTRNSAVVMGPKTYASIGHPLKGRLNIVLTSNRSYKAPPEVLVAHDKRHALDWAATKGYAEFFVIGGAMVYTSFIDDAERIFTTEVWSEEEGDTTFPYWNKSLWHEVYRQGKWWKGVRDSHPIRFVEYARKLAPPDKDEQVTWHLPDEAEWRKRIKISTVSKEERARLFD